MIAARVMRIICAVTTSVSVRAGRKLRSSRSMNGVPGAIFEIEGNAVTPSICGVHQPRTTLTISAPPASANRAGRMGNIDPILRPARKEPSPSIRNHNPISPSTQIRPNG